MMDPTDGKRECPQTLAGHPGWRSRALNERRMVEARMSLRFVAGDLEISRDALRRALRESY